MYIWVPDCTHLHIEILLMMPNIDVYYIKVCQLDFKDFDRNVTIPCENVL